MDYNEKKAKADETKTEEQNQQPFNALRDYIKDSRFADFTKHETQIIDDNGRSHGYKLAPDKSTEQFVIEKTVLGKKLGKAGILFLIGIASLVITTVLPNLLVQHMDMDLLRTLYYAISGIGSVIGIIGACKLVATLHNPIRVGDILKYSDAIDKKMKKKGGEGDLERWRERLRKLRKAQEEL